MEDRGDGLIGRLLEQRYRVDMLLARGGMSAVYRGVDTRLDRPVAIKVMDPRFAEDETFVGRFEREARATARIHHPNVVAVHDQGIDQDTGQPDAGALVYLVMELVEGGTLRDLITGRGALPVPLALSVLERVLSALAAAHRSGLIHRDVKPENVLIGRDWSEADREPAGRHREGADGIVKVADFGLVRAVSGAGLTSSRVILGTAAYLAPEQVSTGAASARGDVYSAGIVLYEALTGTPPYTGDNPLSIAYRHVNDDVPAPSTVVGGIHPMVDDLVVRATRRDATARPLDGDAFLDELRQVMRTLSIPRVPVPVPDPALVGATVPVSESDRAMAVGSEGTDASPEVGSASGTLEADEKTAEWAGGRSTAAVPAVPTAGATVFRSAPVGFSATGPRGTKAMLRPDLDRAAPPPEPPNPGPPVVTGHPSFPSGMPAQAGGPRMGPPPARPHQLPRRRGRAGRIVLWSLIVLLLLSIAGTTTWWFTTGRWTAVPEVRGKDSASAQQLIEDAGLSPNIVKVRHNDVEAGRVIETKPEQGASVLRGDTVDVVVSMGRPRVPSVMPGASVEDAKRALAAEQLRPLFDDGVNEYSDEVPKDTVVRLDPEPGTELDINSPVTVVLSLGPAPVPVPDVRGKSKDEAFQILTDAGFEPYEVEGGQFDPEVDGGLVVGTDPPAQTVLEDGDKRVGVIVSTAVTVPDLLGAQVADAEQAITDLGLVPVVQHLSGGDENSTVYAVAPGGGTRVEAGSEVILYAFP